jgi:hypothetical protein
MSHRRIVINVAAALAVVSAPAVASAQGAGPEGGGTTGTQQEPAGRGPVLPQVSPSTPSGIFGYKSQIAISSDAGFSLENTSQSGVSGSTTTLILHPAMDYFIIDNLSLGGFVGVDYLSTQGGHTTTFSIGPRVGYNLPLSSYFSVWPKVGMSFASVSQSQDVVAAGGATTSVSTNSTALALNLFVPFLFHPVEHFFVGLGPALDIDLTGDNKTTTIGARLTTGGWF